MFVLFDESSEKWRKTKAVARKATINTQTAAAVAAYSYVIVIEFHVNTFHTLIIHIRVG